MDRRRRLANMNVKRLIEGFGEAGDTEDSHVFSTFTSEEAQAAEVPSPVIDEYKLLEQIGEGGMGVVYMAEQTHPIHRKVALKIIKPGHELPPCRRSI